MLSPFLSTVRCNLRPVTRIDYQDLLALYGSSDVRRFLGGPVDADRFTRRFEAMLHATDLYQWSARLKESDKFIGLFSLDKHHDGQDVELSYQLTGNMQRKGFGYEVCESLVGFAFNDLNLKRLVSETQTENVASVRLLERLGMKPERILCRFGVQQSVFAINR